MDKERPADLNTLKSTLKVLMDMHEYDRDSL